MRDGGSGLCVVGGGVVDCGSGVGGRGRVTDDERAPERAGARGVESGRVTEDRREVVGGDGSVTEERGLAGGSGRVTEERWGATGGQEGRARVLEGGVAEGG